MTLRTRFTIYLLLVHLLLGVTAALLWTVNPWWTVGLEATIVLSLVVGVKLVGRQAGTISMLVGAKERLAEQEFTTRLLAAGLPELDPLIAAYNQMVDHLRHERVRLQEQQWFLEKIVAACPSGIVTLDSDGRLAQANPAAQQILGSSETELRARFLPQLPGEYGEQLAGLAQGESRLVVLPGGRRVRARLSFFFDQGIQRAFLLLEELTAELQRSEKQAYGKLIRMMAHEINNSIGASNSLLGSCLTFAAKLDPDDRRDFEQALGLAIARGEHLNRFLKRFADVVRLPEPLRASCDLGELVGAAVRLIRAGADRSIDWQLQWDLPGPMVRVDRDQLEQVLINLLKNAVEAAGPAGRVAVTIEPRPSGCRLKISDSGAGIAPEVRAQLFTPFFTTKAAGQGIGLTVAREVLTAHDLRFGLESEPGRPTCFWIDF